METEETLPVETAAPAPGMEKRKYVKIKTGDFVKIANAEGTIKGTAKKTGMSYSGVRLKLKSLKGSGCALKASLFEGRWGKKAD